VSAVVLQCEKKSDMAATPPLCAASWADTPTSDQLRASSLHDEQAYDFSLSPPPQNGPSHPADLQPPPEPVTCQPIALDDRPDEGFGAAINKAATMALLQEASVPIGNVLAIAVIHLMYLVSGVKPKPRNRFTAGQ
jgi:hypothetical protein